MSVLVQRKVHAAGLGVRRKAFVWLAPSLPFPLQTEENPAAPSRELCHAITGGLRADAQGFVRP